MRRFGFHTDDDDDGAAEAGSSTMFVLSSPLSLSFERPWYNRNEDGDDCALVRIVGSSSPRGVDDVVDVEMMEEEKASTSCSQVVLLLRRAADIRIAIFTTIVDDDFVICSNLPYETPIELGRYEELVFCVAERGGGEFILSS